MSQEARFASGVGRTNVVSPPAVIPVHKHQFLPVRGRHTIGRNGGQEKKNIGKPCQDRHIKNGTIPVMSLTDTTLSTRSLL
jgi:hypothetical protein